MTTEIQINKDLSFRTTLLETMIIFYRIGSLSYHTKYIVWSASGGGGGGGGGE